MDSIITPEITTLVVQAFVSLIGVLVTALLATGLRFLRSKLTAEQFGQVQDVVAIGVSAAEQLGLNDLVMDKKAVAEGIIIRELDKRGIKVDQTRLDALIEAAVLDAFNYAKAQEPATETVTVNADFPVGGDTTGI